MATDLQKFRNAIEKWCEMAEKARRVGYSALAERFYPATSKWWDIEKATEQLREAMKVNGVE